MLSSRIRDKRYLNDLDEYLKKLLGNGNIVAILLYGSLSRGLAKPYPESDIDLLIIAKKLPGEILERKIQASKLKGIPMAVDDIWLTVKELMEGVEGGWGLILDALADGIPIYDPEGILKAAKEAVEKRYRRIGKVWVLNLSYTRRSP
ncbi:MAG: nucleotidyltransferase domain-containing protein [Candidatus Bathyarchaeia archaeon]|nr:nucleotidyltransferase domain-containing protein [Candidatus Bathyarchaeota archaeon]